MAMGWAAEVEYHLLLAKDLEYIGGDDFSKAELQLKMLSECLLLYSRQVRENQMAES
jgi:hypothetical protein